MERRKIIMDVDTGSDDAVALILAMLDDTFDLLGITSVNGNVEVKLCTENSLRMVELCGMEDKIGVYRGADLPLVSTLLPNSVQNLRGYPRREGCEENKTMHHAEHIDTPKFTIKEKDESAVVWLINTLLASKDKEITLIPVGPLTNIALAMRSDPRIIPKIKEIVIMGGANKYTGGYSSASEFNVWVDPEACEVVLQSGCKITMVPLDATFSAYISDKDVEDIRAIGGLVAETVADLILKYGTASFLADQEEVQIPIHDALAVCAVRYPEVLNTQFCNVHTDISGGFAYGATLIDKRTPSLAEKPNCHFAHSANRELFVSWIKETLKNAK